MSFCITSSSSKHFFNSLDSINMSISERINRHKSISLSSSSKKSATGIYSFSSNSTTVIQEPNKFTNIKTYSHKANKNQFYNYSTLPKVSIDLNDTLNLKLDEIKDLRIKLKELSKDKIKLINKNYIKVLSNLRETIDKILLTNGQDSLSS